MSKFNQDEADHNFDLPIVEPTKSTKPRVHESLENVCVACEG